MVKHIVMWKIKPEFSDKNLVLTQLKEKLENLNGKIEGMIHLEIGFDYSNTEASYDLVLYSEFENESALSHYQTHPLHVEAASFVREHTFGRALVDYLK